MSPYTVAADAAAEDDDERFADRRSDLYKYFFQKNVLDEATCLHYLLPPPCIVSHHLRQISKFQSLRTRTLHFSNSFIVYALNNYQDSG